MSSGNRLGRKRRTRNDDKRTVEDVCYRCDVADEVVVKFFVECRIYRVSRTGKQQCVTIRCRANDSLGGNIASCAHPVLNDELLPHPLRQPLPYQPSEDIGGAAGGEANDDTHRPGRIGLLPRDVRRERQRGSARGQMQKFPSVGKFHGVISLMRATNWLLRRFAKCGRRPSIRPP